MQSELVVSINLPRNETADPTTLLQNRSKDPAKSGHREMTDVVTLAQNEVTKIVHSKKNITCKGQWKGNPPRVAIDLRR